MDSIDSLKKHLVSAQNLKKIVSTMKTLAGTNIKKYEKISLNVIKYMNNINLGFQGILYRNKQIINNLDFIEKDIENDEKKQTTMIVIGSNQGLCGRFNDRIVDYFLKDNAEENLNQDNFKIITIGDKIHSMLSFNNVPIYKHIILPNSIDTITNIVYSIIMIMEEFSKKLSSQNLFIYFTAHDPKSNGILTKKQIIPLDRNFFAKLSKKKWPTNNVPLWKVDIKTLLVDFIKQFIFINIYYSLSSSMTAEQKNRLITLQGAEDNINENITETTLKYNQTRQTIITSELLDVVSGYKALRKHKKVIE